METTKPETIQKPIRINDPSKTAALYLSTRKHGDRSWQAWQVMDPLRMYKIFKTLLTKGVGKYQEERIWEVMQRLQEQLMPF